MGRTVALPWQPPDAGSGSYVFIATHSLKADDGGGLAPEALEVVEGALLRAEEVDDYVAEVQQHPAGVRVPFAPAQAHVVRAQPLGQRVDHSIHLPFAEDGTDHEPVGEPRHAADVDDGD